MFNILLIFFINILINKSQSLSECNVENLNRFTKIIGGQTVKPLEFPWMGSIQLKYFDSHNCGATLISDQWVLTAAHCMRKSRQPFTWKVKFGKHFINKNEETERDFNISKVFVHPNYSNITKVNDITLMKLWTKVDFSGKDKHLKPICLPSKTMRIAAGTVCLATGWGKRGNNETISNVLQKVPKQLIDHNTCVKSWPNIDFPINEGHICFSGLEDNKGVCNGDSGGPVQCQATNGQWVQMGIASWTSNPCAIKKYPSIFTKISNYRDWITDIISKN